MTRATCTGQPVSWLALEQHALGHLDPSRAGEVAAHLDACPACRAARDSIDADAARALPPLPDLALAAARRRRARRVAVAGTVTALAAAAALLLIWPRPAPPPELAGTKGGDDLAIGLVRERAGDIAFDPAGFLPGDRFQVEITCARAGEVDVEVTVIQAGEVDRPIPPTRIRCGNRIALPGAFRLTGDGPASVCASAAGARSCRGIVPE